MTYNSTGVPGRLYAFLTSSGRGTKLRRRLLRGKRSRRSAETSSKATASPVASRLEARAADSSTAAAPTVSDVTSGTSASMTILVGDIGGTNARLSVWELVNGDYRKIFEQWYPTRDYREDGFAAVLRDLCRNKDVQQHYPSTACFAIAGPVSQNTAKMTNLGWIIDADAIQRDFDWRVALVNDFEALGYGIPLLDPSDLIVLNDQPVDDQAPIAVLGPGTGLGEAQLMWDEGQGSYKQRALQEWIIDGYGYCELEHVACGAGLERIYTFLNSNGKIAVTEPPLLQAPEISKLALSGADAVASAALDMMLSIIGAEAGHMGLRCLARGGVYIAGGITPKVIKRVKSGVVLDAFLHEEGHRFRPLLQSFRLCAVLNEEVGLIGCRHQATKLLFSA